MALGATPQGVLRLVIGRTSRLALAGVVLGLAGSLALAPALKSMLFSVSSSDPFTLASVGLSLLLVAVIASYVPARRAAHIDPVQTLRQE